MFVRVWAYPFVLIRNMICEKISENADKTKGMSAMHCTHAAATAIEPQRYHISILQNRRFFLAQTHRLYSRKTFLVVYKLKDLSMVQCYRRYACVSVCGCVDIHFFLGRKVHKYYDIDVKPRSVFTACANRIRTTQT